MSKNNKTKSIYEPVSLEAQLRLMQVMNDTPSLVKLADTEWEITALKPAVQHLIAEEAVKIQIADKATIGDVLKAYATNLPAVCRVITLALLNDKERIKNDYDTIYEVIMWESEQRDWALLLSEILQLIDIRFFFLSTKAIQTFQTMTAERKMTMKEVELLSQGQNGGK